MKRIISLLSLLIILCASSAWANQKMYKVEKQGECLSTIGVKLGVDWHKIAEENKISDPYVIRVGQNLLVPDVESEAKAITPRLKTVVKTVKKAREDGLKSGPWNPGRNPWKLGKIEGVKRSPFLSSKGKEGLIGEINAGRRIGAQVRHDGKVFDDLGNEYEMLAMGFGKGRFFKPIPAWKDVYHSEFGWMYTFEGEYILFPRMCDNPTPLRLVPKEPVKVEIPPAPVVPEEVTPETPMELPPIFREVVEEKECVQCEHEVDAGMGVWQNKERDVHGLWWYAQYLLTLQRCEDGNINIFGGTAVPKIGIFAKGDLGETDAGYKWNSWGAGPEIGFIWTGLASNGYPHQVQFMFRTLWEHLHGENSSSGYGKDEDHFLLGYYFEYLRKFAPKLTAVLYTEGYFDISGSIDSTWSGDQVSDRAGFAFGAKIHKDFSKDWAGRLGAQIGLAPHEDRWGLNLNAEARWREWLMFGPSLDYTLASAVAGAAGGYSYGPFIRFELKHEVRKKYSVIRTEEVEPADHQLLNY